MREKEDTSKPGGRYGHGTDRDATAAATPDRFGQLDALVTTVGGAERVAVAEMTLREWTDMLTFNLTSQFLTARAALPVMRRQQRGSIVAVASNLA
jgi:NAD(P)-dependent dehydrogenase (short-subunit alcohol dehydrogenase family)